MIFFLFAMTEAGMFVLDHIYMVMINFIGCFSSKTGCFVDIHRPVYADDKVGFPVHKSEVMRYGNNGHDFA